jgi:hypothetical protein
MKKFSVWFFHYRSLDYAIIIVFIYRGMLYGRFVRLLPDKGQVTTDNSGGSQDSVPGSVDPLDGQFLTEIPDQVSDTVTDVEDKWVSAQGLDTVLQNNRQACEGRHQGGGVEVDSQDGSSGERTGQGVESTSHSNTGDSVEGGQDPG